MLRISERMLMTHQDISTQWEEGLWAGICQWGRPNTRNVGFLSSHLSALTCPPAGGLRRRGAQAPAHRLTHPRLSMLSAVPGAPSPGPHGGRWGRRWGRPGGGSTASPGGVHAATETDRQSSATDLPWASRGPGSPTSRSALAWAVKQLLLGHPHCRLRTELPRLG